MTMGGVDVTAVAKVLSELSDVLPAEELIVQRTLPRISSADALDVALKRSLARLRYELNRESFEFLRWKVEQVRAESDRIRGARTATPLSRQRAATISSAHVAPPLPSAPNRDARAGLAVEAARALATATPTACRYYQDENRIVWTVTELATGAQDSGRARCLVFSSEDAVTCLWTYPVYWNDLTDGLLDALRRQS
jgi:hypothetical protein